MIPFFKVKVEQKVKFTQLAITLHLIVIETSNLVHILVYEKLHQYDFDLDKIAQGQNFRNISINPFGSIGRTGTSKAKVEVRDICLNISFLTSFSNFFLLLYEKKFKVFSLKKKKVF